MSDPERFFATDKNGDAVASGNDPAEVQATAEKYAEERPGEYVHLYQHVMSIRHGD